MDGGHWCIFFDENWVLILSPIPRVVAGLARADVRVFLDHYRLVFHLIRSSLRSRIQTVGRKERKMDCTCPHRSTPIIQKSNGRHGLEDALPLVLRGTAFPMN